MQLAVRSVTLSSGPLALLHCWCSPSLSIQHLSHWHTWQVAKVLRWVALGRWGL